MEAISVVILIILLLCLFIMTLSFINILLNFQKIAIYNYHFTSEFKVNINNDCRKLQNRKPTMKFLLTNCICDNHILLNFLLSKKKGKLSQSLFRLSSVILLYLTLIIIVNKYDEFDLDINGFSTMILINLFTIAFSLFIFKILGNLFKNQMKEINPIQNLFLDVFFVSFAILITALSILAIFSTVYSESGNPIFLVIFFLALFFDVLAFRIFVCAFFFFIENVIFRKSDQELFKQYLILLEEELFFEKVSLNKELSPEIDLEMNNKSERLLLIKNEEKSFSISHLSKWNNSFIFENKKKIKNNKVCNEDEDKTNKNQEEDISSDKEEDLGKEEIDSTGLQFRPKHINHNTPLNIGFEEDKLNSGEIPHENNIKEHNSIDSKYNQEIIIKNDDLNNSFQIKSKSNQLLIPNKFKKYDLHLDINEKKRDLNVRGNGKKFSKSCVIAEEKFNFNKFNRRSQSAFSIFNSSKYFQTNGNIIRKIENLKNKKSESDHNQNKIKSQNKSQESGDTQTVSSKHTSEQNSQKREILNSKFTKLKHENKISESDLKESHNSEFSLKNKTSSPKKKFVNKTAKTKRTLNDENNINQKVISLNEITLDKSSISNSSIKFSAEKNDFNNKTKNKKILGMGRKENLQRSSLSRDDNKFQNNILNGENSLNQINNEQQIIAQTRKSAGNQNKIRQGRFKNKEKSTFLNDLTQEMTISGNIEKIKKKGKIILFLVKNNFFSYKGKFKYGKETYFVSGNSPYLSYLPDGVYDAGVKNIY